jgi:4,5-dihydroxyphthalate decarboxylase
MPNPKIRFHYHEPDIDTQRPIVEGQVKIEGFDLEIVAPEAHDFDAWDAGSSGLPGTVVEGEPDVSIPAYPNRKFRLSYIFVNNAAGIEHPKDLEGKKVGLAAWRNPAGVWAKGALQNTYGVDLTKVNWFTPEFDTSPVPDGIHVQHIKERRQLDPMLVSGELDAVIEPNRLPSISQRNPAVRRLFRDYKSEEQKYWRETGIFPISHVITLKKAFVDQHPNAPVAVLEAYRRARDVAFDRVEGSDPEYMIIPWAGALIDEQRALMGEDFWAYNIEDNRRTLAALTQFVHEQGITPYRVDYEQLFDPEAATLPGA